MKVLIFILMAVPFITFSNSSSAMQAHYQMSDTLVEMTLPNPTGGTYSYVWCEFYVVGITQRNKRIRTDVKGYLSYGQTGFAYVTTTRDDPFVDFEGSATCY